MNVADDRVYLSKRELQVYGAACLARFCESKRITTPSVRSLVDHLLLVLTAPDLPQWETAGARLELAGRGDPLPTDVVAGLSDGDADDFKCLMDTVVEIGMVDMYGADTSLPSHYLRKSVSLLERSGVEPPRLEELFPRRTVPDVVDWGPPGNSEDHRRLREWCSRRLPID